MSRKPAKKRAKRPAPKKTMEQQAQLLYKERYEGKYASKEGQFPQLEQGLKELARISIQLDSIAARLEEEEMEDRDPFLAKPSGKAPYASPLRKQQDQLRAHFAKVAKILNLSLERKAVMKAEHDAEMDDIEKDL